MPHFDAMTQQKLRLKKAILNNQKLCNLLVNPGDNIEAFEDVPLGSKGPAAEFVKTYFFAPGTLQEGHSYIVMQSSADHVDSNVVKQTCLTVYVMCSDRQIEMLQGSRADLIADELDKIINTRNNQLFGVGDIQLGLAIEARFADGYSGWSIPYLVHEQNRDAFDL